MKYGKCSTCGRALDRWGYCTCIPDPAKEPRLFRAPRQTVTDVPGGTQLRLEQPEKTDQPTEEASTPVPLNGPDCLQLILHQLCELSRQLEGISMLLSTYRAVRPLEPLSSEDIVPLEHRRTGRVTVSGLKVLKEAERPQLPPKSPEWL